MANKNSAMNMLKTSKTVKERAEVFYKGIKRDLFTKIITSLEQKIEKKDELIFSLSDFSLDTDLNAGLQRLSQEDCQNKFEKLIQAKYEKQILELELKLKTDIYNELFAD